MKRSRTNTLVIRWMFILFAMCAYAAVQADDRTPPAAPTNSAALPLDVNELKIEIAESTLKIHPSLRALSELTGALETYLNRHCFPSLLKTLKYAGKPTDPQCVARMERLLEIYPNNPAAVCVRDGIEAPSCVQAYQDQRVEPFSGSSSPDEIPDPALKIGLSAQSMKKVQALSQDLKGMKAQRQTVANESDKQKSLEGALDIYEQLLRTTCEISAIQLRNPSKQSSAEEDPSIRDIREKLLKLSAELRPEYQRRFLQEAEAELASAQGNTEKQSLILKKIKVIESPEALGGMTAAGKLRVRIVLPKCYEIIGQASQAAPYFPYPVCYREGWQTPQCIAALKAWYAHKRRAEIELRKRDPNAPVPTPRSLITTF